MTERFDVAVVGGGIIGLSVGRELRHAGVDRVVVLEREASVGLGSSSRANGGVRAQFTTPINVAFSLYSIAELERLRDAYTELLAFHQTGYLFVTGTAEGEGALRSAMSLQRSLGVETVWLNPDEILKHATIIRAEGLRGGTFHARDGFLDPHGALEAMRLECRREGATIRTDASITRVAKNAHGFTLTSSGGELVAGHVVDAAGAHAREIGRMVGVDVPVEPVRRHLAFVQIPGEPPGLIPMCIDVETGVLVRREVGGGYVLAYSDPADPPGWDTSVDPRWLDELAARIGNRFPALADAPVDARHCWAGLYPETADHHAIIGETAMPSFFVCAGFGGHGLMHAPAAGRAIAELVIRGECTTFDLRPLRPSRFAEGDLVVEAAVL